MLNEEKYISEKIGKRNPFTVPEGYFEQLTGTIMSKLPDATDTPVTAKPEPVRQPALIRRLRPWVAAACICGAIICAAAYLYSSNTTSANQEELADATYSDAYIDEAADYAMVDNQDIYAYLLADI